jgi:predicted nucleic acid-binding protein
VSYLLDSDRIIDALHSRHDAVDLVANLAADGIAISVITLGELYEGTYRGPNAQARLSQLRQFAHQFPILPVTEPVIEIFAEHRAQLRAQGTMIADLDLLIASTALHHDLILVTRNLRHFRRVSGLRIYGQTST